MATTVATNSKEFNCNACTWGKSCNLYPDSNGPASYPKFGIEKGGVRIESNICFLELITSDTRAYMKLYRHYNKSILPLSGGLLDQPAVYLNAMEIIERWQ